MSHAPGSVPLGTNGSGVKLAVVVAAAFARWSCAAWVPECGCAVPYRTVPPVGVALGGPDSRSPLGNVDTVGSG